MIIHCKACDRTFDPEQYNCDEDLLCPLMQIQIIEKDNAENDTEDDQPGEGNQAPSESINRAQK